MNRVHFVSGAALTLSIAALSAQAESVSCSFDSLPVAAFELNFSVTPPDLTAGSGKAHISDIHLTRRVDASSPTLVRSAITGGHFGTVTCSLYRDVNSGEADARSSGSRVKYLTFEMKEVVISSYYVSPMQASDKPAESISLNFGSIEYAYD